MKRAVCPVLLFENRVDISYESGFHIQFCGIKCPFLDDFVGLEAKILAFALLAGNPSIAGAGFEESYLVVVAFWLCRDAEFVGFGNCDALR